MRRTCILTVFALVLVCVTPAASEEAEGCLESLTTMLPTDSIVRIATIHNKIFTGKLTELDLVERKLTVKRTIGKEELQTFPVDQISMIRLRQKGKFKGEWMFLGLVGGVAAGVGIGSVATGDAGNDDLGAAFARLLIPVGLGVGGAIAGALIPMRTQTTDLRCR